MHTKKEPHMLYGHSTLVVFGYITRLRSRN